MPENDTQLRFHFMEKKDTTKKIPPKAKATTKKKKAETSTEKFIRLTNS